MPRSSKRLEIDGYTEEFQQLLKATPAFGKDQDGIDRDISPSVRRNMALGMWLAKQSQTQGPEAALTRGDA